jgi:hypothetical protein
MSKGDEITKTRLDKLYDAYANPTTWGGMLPTTVLSGASALGQIGLGVYGLFKDTPDFESGNYNYEYEKDANLENLETLAIARAMNPNDDFGSRKRIQGQKSALITNIINNSGGNRAFIQGNMGAAEDFSATANLDVDRQMEGIKAQNMSLANQIAQTVQRDKMGEMQNKMYENQDRYQRFKDRTSWESSNFAGSVGLIDKGINQAVQVAQNESMWGKEGTARMATLADILIEMQRAGIDPNAGLGPVNTGKEQGPPEEGFERDENGMMRPTKIISSYDRSPWIND